MELRNLKINLIPQKELEERALGKLLKWSLTFGRYIIVGTELVVLLAFFSRFKLDRQITDLREQIAQKEAIVNYNQEFEQQVRGIQTQLNEIKIISQNQDLGVKILHFFEENIPKEVTIEKFSSSPNNISLSGSSLSTTAFIDFLARVRGSEKFSQVRLENVVKTEGGEINFSLVAEIIPEKFY